jgi:hypothetical protein
MPNKIRAALAVTIAFIVAPAAKGLPCYGEYQTCPDGTCVLDASLCGVCKGAGEFLCPDGTTCVPTVDSVENCPPGSPLYNWSAPLDERVAGTLALLTPEEKAALIIMVSPGVPRLGIPAYNAWTVRNGYRANSGEQRLRVTPQYCHHSTRAIMVSHFFLQEAQHGWIGDGPFGWGNIPSSSYPATGTLANAWMPLAFARGAAMTALECRGQHNAAVTAGVRTANSFSLTLFAPETNLVRVPLWGRVQETVGGEDPLLTGRHAAAYVHGMQVRRRPGCKRWLASGYCDARVS